MSASTTQGGHNQFIEGRRHCRQLLAVTHYNAVTVSEHHLRFVNGRHIACKRLVKARAPQTTVIRP